MTDIKNHPAYPEGTRPETGPMQFGDDWPGVFFRGDDAFWFARIVRDAMALAPKEDRPYIAMLKGLAETLESCSVGDTGWPPRQTSTKETNP